MAGAYNDELPTVALSFVIEEGMVWDTEALICIVALKIQLRA